MKQKPTARVLFQSGWTCTEEAGFVVAACASIGQALRPYVLEFVKKSQAYLWRMSTGTWSTVTGTVMTRHGAWLCPHGWCYLIGLETMFGHPTQPQDKHVLQDKVRQTLGPGLPEGQKTVRFLGPLTGMSEQTNFSTVQSRHPRTVTVVLSRRRRPPGTCTMKHALQHCQTPPGVWWGAGTKMEPATNPQ